MKLSYDLHTHILPSFDDGAKSVDEALTLIKALKAAGVQNICLTPHFYSHKESVQDFVSRRDKAAREFLSVASNGVNLKLGAEVFVTPYLFSEEQDLLSLCIMGTSYMLVEFPYAAGFKGESMKLMMRLISIGITPILAHVERYPALLKNLDVLEELIYMGVIIQSNACSFVDKRSKAKLLKLLKNGYIQVLSSDTHSMSHNPPMSYSEILPLFKSKCPDVLKSLELTARDIWNNN